MKLSLKTSQKLSLLAEIAQSRENEISWAKDSVTRLKESEEEISPYTQERIDYENAKISVYENLLSVVASL